MAQDTDFTVRVMILTPYGTPLVRSMFHPDPYWKFPGGGNKAKDRGSVPETARRESKGETGLDIDMESIETIAKKVHETGHHIELVKARAKNFSFSDLLDVNEDGEEVALFRPKQFQLLVGQRAFLPQHLELLQLAAPAYQRLVLPRES